MPSPTPTAEVVEAMVDVFVKGKGSSIPSGHRSHWEQDKHCPPFPSPLRRKSAALFWAYRRSKQPLRRHCKRDRRETTDHMATLPSWAVPCSRLARNFMPSRRAAPVDYFFFFHCRRKSMTISEISLCTSLSGAQVNRAPAKSHATSGLASNRHHFRDFDDVFNDWVPSCAAVSEIKNILWDNLTV